MMLLERALDLSLRKIFRKLSSPFVGEIFTGETSTGIEEILGYEDAKRISNMPRFTEGYAEVNGMKVKFNDNESFFGMLDEIFIKKNYLFNSSNKKPLIIDCGANIGLGVLYFKSIFPDAVIHAFEPDDSAFESLRSNVQANNLKDVHLHKEVVWIRREELEFFSDGSWGGGVFKKKGAIKKNVQAIDINSYLGSPVDFLKMDIEGAENEVIEHSAEFIVKNVKKFFFEWHSLKDSQQKLGVFLNIFENSGFRYHIKEASKRSSPFVNCPRGEMDSQLDVFIYKN